MRIMAIDFGTKRTGIAVTDPLKIIATGLTTVETQNIMTFLKDYIAKEPVEHIIIGEPKNLDDSDTHATAHVREFIKRLKKYFLPFPFPRSTSALPQKWLPGQCLKWALKKRTGEIRHWWMKLQLQ